MRGRMSRADRAKQFMPFAALKGYEQALRRREAAPQPRVELGEDARETLDRKLRQVRKNDVITAVYYRGGEYVELTGMVSRIDFDTKLLRIVKTQIPVDDLLDIHPPAGLP